MKCDELHPVCMGCTTSGFSCDWPPVTQSTAPRSKKPKSKGAEQGRPLPSSKEGVLNLGCGDRGSLSGSLAADSYQPITIRAALAERQWECANSITLTLQDRWLLENFPSTSIFGWYNYGRRNTMQYLVRNLAPSSSVVTHMLIALSASEAQRRGLHIGLNTQHPAVELGLYHYNVALSHLREFLVMDHGRVGAFETLPAMLAVIFFMIRYENQSLLSPERIKMHVGGLWALLNSHPLFQKQLGNEDRALPSVPCQAIDFILPLSCRIIELIMSVSPSLLYVSPQPVCKAISSY